jgi:hypothetical protein
MILHDPLDWRRSTKHAGIESFDNCRKEAIPFDYRGAIISGSKRLKSRVEQTKESCLILSNPFKENPSGKDRSCLLSVQFVIIVAVVVIVVIPLALPPPLLPLPHRETLSTWIISRGATEVVRQGGPAGGKGDFAICESMTLSRSYVESGKFKISEFHWSVRSSRVIYTINFMQPARKKL